MQLVHEPLHVWADGTYRWFESIEDGLVGDADDVALEMASQIGIEDTPHVRGW